MSILTEPVRTFQAGNIPLTGFIFGHRPATSSNRTPSPWFTPTQPLVPHV